MAGIVGNGANTVLENGDGAFEAGKLGVLPVDVVLNGDTEFFGRETDHGGDDRGGPAGSGRGGRLSVA